MTLRSILKARRLAQLVPAVYRTAETILALLMLVTIAHAQTPIVIHCGPGLNNCGEAANALPLSGWAQLQPGVFRLAGTDITVSYRLDENDFSIEWHGTKRIRPTAEEAVFAATNWRDQLLQLGYTP